MSNPSPQGASGANKWTNPGGSVKWLPNNGAVKGTEEIVTRNQEQKLEELEKGVDNTLHRQGQRQRSYLLNLEPIYLCIMNTEYEEI